jgi:hypothetical protein
MTTGWQQACDMMAAWLRLLPKYWMVITAV